MYYNDDTYSNTENKFAEGFGLDPSKSDGFFEVAVRALAGIISRLKSQPLLFAIGIGLLLILAFMLSYAFSSFTPFYVIVGALLFIFIVAIIANQHESAQRRRTFASEKSTSGQNLNESESVEVPDTPSSPPGNESKPVDVPAGPSSAPENESKPVDDPNLLSSPPGEVKMPNLMKALNIWLNRLNDTQFRSMIQLILTPEEQTELTKPVYLINRVEFLNDMNYWGRLEELKSWLETYYPNFKPKSQKTP